MSLNPFFDLDDLFCRRCTTDLLCEVTAVKAELIQDAHTARNRFFDMLLLRSSVIWVNEEIKTVVMLARQRKSAFDESRLRSVPTEMTFAVQHGLHGFRF